MPRWWNWYTHKVEGLGHFFGVRVRVPPWAQNRELNDEKKRRNSGAGYIIYTLNESHGHGLFFL